MQSLVASPSYYLPRNATRSAQRPPRSIVAIRILALLLCGLIFSHPDANGQDILADYLRADQFLGWNAEPFVHYDEVAPTWIGDDRFWYRNDIPEGYAFVLVDPDRDVQRPAFDHVKLAAALSEAADTAFVPFQLPFDAFELVEKKSKIQFWIGEKQRWRCDISDYTCAGPDSVRQAPADEVVSPDRRWAAFTQDENIWVRDLEPGDEIPLSTDGKADFGYAVNPEGCCDEITNRRNDTDQRPVLRWSPDARRIATHKLDERGVEPLHLIETQEGRSKLHTYRVALPGDSVVPKYDLYVFDVNTQEKVRIQMDPQEVSNTSCCGLMADTVWKDVRWGPNGENLFFTYGQRSYDRLRLVTANAKTGEARTIIDEEYPTYVELSVVSGGLPNWRVIREGREVVWFSERDGWGHLYRYDVKRGQMINRITAGDWVVVDIKHVDETGGWVYFTAVGREPDLDPYFRQFYRARLDGSAIERLTPEDMDHNIDMAPSGRYFVDTFSKRDTIPTTVLRRADRTLVRQLEEGDVSALQAKGWRWPEPFAVKARDGVTTLHGFIYLPSTFDPEKMYPVIDYIYPGPQVGPIGFRSFTISPRGNPQALAELGFIVVTLDALGTPLRSKAFHDAWYGDMGDNGIVDHVRAIKQLATEYPQMDLSRVGIFGHSGGGFSSAGAILRYPDFFKVAVSSAGNHDNRSYDYTWGEKYQGTLTLNDSGGDSFDSQANHLLAKNLKGHLLLMYGTLDDNVHPNATLLLIDALIEHNKNFDVVVLPNRNHGFFDEPYVIRKRWDYFVEHLRGESPPSSYSITPPEHDE